MTQKKDMVAVLEAHGPAFAGNSVEDEAQDWLDQEFDAAAANAWCEIGVWDAGTAQIFRAAGKTPDEIAAAARALAEAEEDPAEVYTDGDPIYAACNNDLRPQVLIDACGGK